MLTLAVATRAETFERIREPLAERGIEVRHVRTTERTVRLTAPGDEWAGTDVGFVYPGRIMEGGVADALLSVPWVNDREAVLRSRNKAGALARLSRADVPVPATVQVSNPCDPAAVREAAADLGYPLVVKPNSTTRGVGVTRVTDPDSLSGVVDYLDVLHESPVTGDRSYLLQEYLPDARDYRAMVVDGAYAGAVERRLPAAALAADRWKHNVHRGAEASGVTLPPEARELVEAAADALDVPYLGVDLLETEEGFAVTETNARPTIDEATKYEPGFYDRLAGLIRATAEGTPD